MKLETQAECPTCQGTQYISLPSQTRLFVCPTCQGSGSIHVPTPDGEEILKFVMRHLRVDEQTGRLERQ